MQNKLLSLLVLLTLIFVSCQQGPSQIETLKADKLEILWQKPSPSISSSDLLRYQFTAIHPLASSIEIKPLESEDFELFDQKMIVLPPASPTQLRTQFELSFEPPAPGQYKTPQVSLILLDKNGVLAQLKTPESEIIITSINPPDDFIADHRGSLKQRPTKWLLLSLLFFALPFLPKKKKAKVELVLKVKDEDLEQCEANFEAIEILMQKIMQYNFLIKKNDFNTMLSQLANDEPQQKQLKYLIENYQRQRFSGQSISPEDLLSQLKKTFKEIQS